MAAGPGRHLSSVVMDDLGRKIVSGLWAPGYIINVDALERKLGVSRTVVREAVKVLTSKGLIAARPKFGTYVRERADWNLLDADVMSWRDLERPDPDLIRDLNELRRMLEPATARLAAKRRTDEHLAAMDEALAALGSADVEEYVDSDLRFHRALADATNNELLSRLDAVLKVPMGIRDRLAFAGPHTDEFLELHAALAAAVKSGDPDAAELACHRMLDAAEKDAAAAARFKAGRGSRRR